MTRKIALRRPATLSFSVLAAAKRLRGTPLDAFGRTEHRRIERGLADEYRRHIEVALIELSNSALSTESGSHRYKQVVNFLALADQVRGFDHIKERNIEAWRIAADHAQRDLTATSSSVA
jgi:indolepyruvate ferredoxin oxidoreductase